MDTADTANELDGHYLILPSSSAQSSIYLDRSEKNDEQRFLISLNPLDLLRIVSTLSEKMLAKMKIECFPHIK